MTDEMKIIYTYTDEAPRWRRTRCCRCCRPTPTRPVSPWRPATSRWPPASSAPSTSGPDALAELGELARTPQANIIKLPNVSASVPQLKAAIAELQAAGFAVPDYPRRRRPTRSGPPATAYDAVKGSAVNPVLREGNSDRRAPASVKRYAQAHPHSMGAWSPDTRSHVATMSDGDFRHSETVGDAPAATTLRIEHVGADGSTTVLKDGHRGPRGRDRRRAVMRKAALRSSSRSRSPTRRSRASCSPCTSRPR
jgi:isocitrate dehydrogenase